MLGGLAGLANWRGRARRPDLRVASRMARTQGRQATPEKRACRPRNARLGARRPAAHHKTPARQVTTRGQGHAEWRRGLGRRAATLPALRRRRRISPATARFSTGRDPEPTTRQQANPAHAESRPSRSAASAPRSDPWFIVSRSRCSGAKRAYPSAAALADRLSDQPACVATKRLPYSRSARAVTPVGEAHIRVHEFGDNPLSDLVQGR